MPGRNPLVNDIGKILSVTRSVPLARLWGALFRTRPGPCPSAELLRRICSAVPGTRIEAGVLSIDRPPARATHLGQLESLVVGLLETEAQGMPDVRVRGLARGIGLPWVPVRRLLYCSPVIERSATGHFRLVGAAG